MEERKLLGIAISCAVRARCQIEKGYETPYNFETYDYWQSFINSELAAGSVPPAAWHRGDIC